jgi:TATA-box binding protein (TBP) (component of TFIID and TFIIIB)
MTSKIGTDIDIPTFNANFKKRGNMIRIRNKNSKFGGFIWKKNNTTFYNQVTISYTDQYSTKSVKLFPNGSVQVAGCSNLVDCQRVATYISYVIKTVLELKELPVLEPPTIQMINTNFSLNCSVNLKKVIAKFEMYRTILDNTMHPIEGPEVPLEASGDHRFDVTFDPDKYSAVKIKFEPQPGMKRVTASIFSTGKVIVTGARALDEIVGAYETINRMITANERVAVSEKKESFDVFMGVKFEDWKKYLS